MTYDFYERTNDPQLKLVVYNLAYEELRIVVLRPGKNWGDGMSLLGVEFGSGVVNDFREAQKYYQMNRTQNTEKLEGVK